MLLFKNAISFLMVLGCAVFLSACGPNGKWKTHYANPIVPGVSANWRVHKIDVSVPESLTVSEANTFAPEADIVWRGEKIGDRYQQVTAIISDAAKVGTEGMTGIRPVRLEIEVLRFHALTEKTRFTLQRSGVHNIRFHIQVVDEATGEPLSSPEVIQADLIGYTGTQAHEAVAAGQTQRVRIVDHVAKVIAGWLGRGPDVRGSFSRAGR